MATQLNKSPYPVFKIEAATNKTQFDLCPSLKGLDGRGDVGTRNRGGQSALFCSNQLAWKSGASSKADFIIVLEDDTIFDQENFWPQLQKFLDSDCEGQQWDQVLVDTIHAKGKGKEYSCKNHALGTAGPISSTLGYGTHMQIFRTSSLHKYLDQKEVHTTDKWSMSPKDTILRGWYPNMVLQTSQLKKLGKLDKLPSFCSASTEHSDIEVAKFAKTQPSKLAFEC